MSDFFYSLRLGIDPKSWSERKERELIKFIKEAKIDDVNIIINSEELNHGHMSKYEVNDWLECSKSIGKAIEPYGVSLSLNPWTTLLHSDRGRVLKPEFSFSTMVDYRGVRATAVACPSDEEWYRYLEEIYGIYASIKPNYIWLDDDFRHFNHKPLQWGCFCEKHMKKYCQALGYEITREKFVERILEEKKVNPERLVYLEIAQKEMEEAARVIERGVHKISPNTNIGLMSSNPEWHQIENRNWKRLLQTLSGSENTYSRPHLPAYNEKAGLHYIRDFNRSTRVVADMLGSHANLFPELENYMYSPYAKSNTFTQLQLETTAMVGAKGVLLNLYDMMGNGVVDIYKHQKILSQSKGLLNYFSNNPIKIDSMIGVSVLYSQESVKSRILSKSELSALLPREFEWLSLLGSFGIACKPYSIEHISMLKNTVVACSDQVLRSLSNKEIITLFLNNKLLIDGSSVEVLFDRKLEYLINATAYKRLEPHTGYQSYEEVIGKELTCGVQHARITMMQQCGCYYNIQYSKITPITAVFNEYGNEIGLGMVESDNVMILPIGYHDQYAWDAQYINYREELIKRYLSNCNDIIYMYEMPVVQVICDKERFVITNYSLDEFEDIKVFIQGWNNKGIKIKIINRAGVQRCIARKMNGYYQIDYKLKGYETICLERDLG